MTFHDLHSKETSLLLPNAWDARSAIAFAGEGFPAIGTTSFGVGAAAGHPDGARQQGRGYPPGPVPGGPSRLRLGRHRGRLQ
jgi:2-methylisocitrate lyase-like PEP mutase family enzyme